MLQLCTRVITLEIELVVTANLLQITTKENSTKTKQEKYKNKAQNILQFKRLTN